MANYLERVASSAGRRAAVAKPPASGPPVLPPGRDLSIEPADPFASDEGQFVETLETSAPARAEARAEIPPRAEVARESKATTNETLVTPVAPEPKPRPSVERLSSEAPFMVQVPRTLRPGATPKVPPTPSDEPPREQPRVRVSTTVGPQEFTIGEEPVPIVDDAAPNVREVKESVTAETNTTTLTPRPKPHVADSVNEYKTPAPVQTEVTLPDTTPIPRVDGPPRLSTQAAEPSPPPALPVHLPPVVSSAARQEQSRISIGSLEVLVNNHPRVTTMRPAATPARSERLNLEKRYLDRFRLRH